MKAIALALLSVVTLAGCASGPYSGYGGYSYYDGYRPYAYEVPAYSYYGTPHYGYPAIGGTFYYDRRDYDRDHWQYRRGDHERWQDNRRDDRGRGPDRNTPSRPREPIDTRHGEAGNEAGM